MTLCGLFVSSFHVSCEPTVLALILLLSSSSISVMLRGPCTFRYCRTQKNSSTGASTARQAKKTSRTMLPALLTPGIMSLRKNASRFLEPCKAVAIPWLVMSQSPLDCSMMSLRGATSRDITWPFTAPRRNTRASSDIPKDRGSPVTAMGKYEDIVYPRSLYIWVGCAE